jgi:acyl-[acyl carrier protein]--UDP-N-acetylglucosamine O-acyltransferase
VTNVTLSLSLGLTLATIIIISIADFGTIKAYGQSMTATTPGMNNAIMQQHAAHILDNLIISEHIPLTGQLTSGDYMLLMDFTPFATSVEGHSHIAMKAPCNQDGSPKVTIVAGVSPNLSTLNMGNAINNGTLNGKNLDLSNEGKSCLYRAELPNGITDIALINTSNGTLNFNEGGYSVTVSVHGTAIQHIAK